MLLYFIMENRGINHKSVSASISWTNSGAVPAKWFEGLLVCVVSESCFSTSRGAFQTDFFHLIIWRAVVVSVAVFNSTAGTHCGVTVKLSPLGKTSFGWINSLSDKFFTRFSLIFQDSLSSSLKNVHLYLGSFASVDTDTIIVNPNNIEAFPELSAFGC